jgi:hypothetical protein
MSQSEVGPTNEDPYGSSRALSLVHLIKSDLEFWKFEWSALGLLSAAALVVTGLTVARVSSSTLIQVIAVAWTAGGFAFIEAGTLRKVNQLIERALRQAGDRQIHRSEQNDDQR